jgi:hypothetical protein
LDGFLGVELRRVRVTLSEVICDLGVGASLRLKSSVIREAGLAPFELNQAKPKLSQRTLM